jgi:hypothetical protein
MTLATAAATGWSSPEARMPAHSPTTARTAASRAKPAIARQCGSKTTCVASTVPRTSVRPNPTMTIQSAATAVRGCPANVSTSPPSEPPASSAPIADPLATTAVTSRLRATPG